MTPAQREALDLEQEGLSQRAIAERLGISKKAVWGRLQAAKRHLDLDPGIAEAMAETGLNDAGKLHSGWLKTDGASLYFQAPQDENQPEDIAERVREALEGVKPVEATPSPAHTDDDLLTVYPIADAHIGMQSWARETGEAYDLKIACERLRTWIARAVAASPASHKAVILDVGDLLHADDQKNVTPASKHQLDVDQRYFKTVDMATEALVTATDCALRKHREVVVRILPGNHNPHSYLAILFGLARHYRNEPRVEVQKVPGEFYVERFGNCLLAAHHGDKGKPERMVMAIADDYADKWGQTRHRYLWTGHLHHHKSADIGGVTWEQLRAVAPRDAYAVANAFVARSQLQAITLHRTEGEVMRVKISA